MMMSRGKEKAQYASNNSGTRVWGVMDSSRKVVMETSEDLDTLIKKWGNEFVYTIVIDYKK